MVKQSLNNKYIVTILSLLVVAGLLILGWGNIISNNRVSNDSTSILTNNSTTDGWLVLESDSVPFVFNYPNEWQVIEQVEGNFILSDNVDEKILSIRYVKYPRGMARGVSVCQIEQSENRECSYINNNSIGQFYGLTKNNTWTGELRDQNASIILTLISKDPEKKDQFMGVAESIKLKL